MVEGKYKVTPDLHIMINVLRAMYKTLEEDWTRQAKIYNLTSPQQHLIWILHFRDGSTVTEIANIGLWHISTAMHLIDKLEVKGLVRKERMRNDKRASRVFLTTEGRALRHKMFNDDLAYYKLYSVIHKKREEFGIGWDQLLEFGKAVTQELYGKEYVEFLESTSKLISEESKKEK